MSEVAGVDAVLITQQHPDHVEPGNLTAVLSASPGAVVVAAWSRMRVANDFPREVRPVLALPEQEAVASPDRRANWVKQRSEHAPPPTEARGWPDSAEIPIGRSAPPSASGICSPVTHATSLGRDEESREPVSSPERSMSDRRRHPLTQLGGEGDA